MSAARRAAIRELFAEFGDRLASLLDGEEEPSSRTREERTPRKITDIDKQRARNIARRMGRL